MFFSIENCQPEVFYSFNWIKQIGTRTVWGEGVIISINSTLIEKDEEGNR